MDKISVVIPSYNEEECLPIFFNKLNDVSKSIEKTDFEFIFVDDGSSDNTLNVLKDLRKEDKRVRYLSFSRNFGKDAAIYAGLKISCGDYVAVMDADMQDPPELVKEMYETLKNEDFDQVAVKIEGFTIKSFLPRLIYKINNKVSKTEIVDGAKDYRLMKRVVVNAILSLNEYNRVSKGIFGFVGFKTKWLSIKQQDRAAGKNKRDLLTLTVNAIDNIFAFSTAPLAIPFIFGTLISVLSLINFLIKVIVKAENLSLTFLIFALGLMMICFSIVALYLAKTYKEVLRRPIYFVRETEEGLVDGKN